MGLLYKMLGIRPNTLLEIEDFTNREGYEVKEIDIVDESETIGGNDAYFHRKVVFYLKHPLKEKEKKAKITGPFSFLDRKKDYDEEIRGFTKEITDFAKKRNWPEPRHIYK